MPFLLERDASANRHTDVERRTAVALVAGFVVVLAMVLAALLLVPDDRGLPCVDYIPANVGCAK